MEKIQFDNTTFIWKSKLKFDSKSCIGWIQKRISNADEFENKWGVYSNLSELIKIPEINLIAKKSINFVKSVNQIEKEDLKYDDIKADMWLNIVKSKNPVQNTFDDNGVLKKGLEKYHSHKVLYEKNGGINPDWTWVYYIQMPEKLENDDGALYIMGENGKEYKYIPEVDDIVVMKGDVLHSPNTAPNSTKDRIVLAGNVEFSYTKKKNTII